MVSAKEGRVWQEELQPSKVSTNQAWRSLIQVRSFKFFHS